MSISSSFDESILASAADQLTAASRAAFCITAPMMKMTEHCVAVMASGGFGLTLIEITGSTNLDTVVYLAAYVDFGDAAALGFHHVLTRIPCKQRPYAHLLTYRKAPHAFRPCRCSCA